VISPLSPGNFILIAGIANVGKNISWLSASATRAAIHRSFALKENLADITAKSGSQSVTTSLLGTTLGVAISPFVGSSTENVLAAFVCCSFIHLSANYIALKQVVIDTLNPQRMDLILKEYLVSGKILTPLQVSQVESFGPSSVVGIVSSPPVVVGVEVKKLVPSSERLSHILGVLCEEKYILDIVSWLVVYDPPLHTIFVILSFDFRFLIQASAVS
jgi:hypothetical protein